MQILLVQSNGHVVPTATPSAMSDLEIPPGGFKVLPQNFCNPPLCLTPRPRLPDRWRSKAVGCRATANLVGRPIDEMSRDELASALKAAVAALRSVHRNLFMRPEVEVTETAAGTLDR